MACHMNTASKDLIGEKTDISWKDEFNLNLVNKIKYLTVEYLIIVFDVELKFELG